MLVRLTAGLDNKTLTALVGSVATVVVSLAGSCRAQHKAEVVTAQAVAHVDTTERRAAHVRGRLRLVVDSLARRDSLNVLRIARLEHKVARLERGGATAQPGMAAVEPALAESRLYGPPAPARRGTLIESLTGWLRRGKKSGHPP